MRVFISFAHDDANLAAKLEAALRAQRRNELKDYPLSLKQEDIAGGEAITH